MNIARFDVAKTTLTTNHLVALSAERLKAAKAAYNARRVDLEVATHLMQGKATPRPGDLVLAKVATIGQHTRIELATGRRAQLYVGDEIVVCYGGRYAPDQFEAYVPADLSPCNLVAAGGVAARYVTKHTRMKKPTTIEPVGLLTDHTGERLNIADWSLAPQPEVLRRPHTIAVLGTAMNAGKTTTAAALVRGYKGQDKRVGAAKTTGTGAGGDRWAMLDAGADLVLDFTDLGVPSTFGVAMPQLETIFAQLVNHLAADGAEVIVLEVADGLFQEETGALIGSQTFKHLVDDVVFAAGDALGACAGVSRLRDQDLNVVAVSGALTASPLAVREAQQALGLPVVTPKELNTGIWLPTEDLGPAVKMPTSGSDAPERLANIRLGSRFQELSYAGAQA